MTITQTLSNPVQNGAGASVSALLIPADPRQPPRRIEIEGVDDLKQTIGQQIEGLPCPQDPTIWGYVNALARHTPSSELNVRATSILSPREGWIAGDAVIVAFDADRGECDLPGGFEERITAGQTLIEPQLVIKGARSIVHEWEISNDGNGSRTIAVLTVGHHLAIDELARRYTNEFRALLSNRTETPGLFGETILGDGVYSATVIRREGAWHFSDEHLERFATLALEMLRVLIAASDNRVTDYFRVDAGTPTVTRPTVAASGCRPA